MKRCDGTFIALQLLVVSVCLILPATAYSMLLMPVKAAQRVQENMQQVQSAHHLSQEMRNFFMGYYAKLSSSLFCVDQSRLSALALNLENNTYVVAQGREKQDENIIGFTGFGTGRMPIISVDQEEVRTIIFSPCDQNIIIAGLQNNVTHEAFVKWFDRKAGLPLQTIFFPASKPVFMRLACSANNHYLAVALAEGGKSNVTLAIYDLRILCGGGNQENALVAKRSLDNLITALTFIPESEKIMASLWDAETSTSIINCIEIGQRGEISFAPICFINDMVGFLTTDVTSNTMIGVGSPTAENRCCLWKINNNNLLAEKLSTLSFVLLEHPVAFGVTSPDVTYIVVGGGDLGMVTIFQRVLSIPTEWMSVLLKLALNGATLDELSPSERVLYNQIDYSLRDEYIRCLSASGLVLDADQFLSVEIVGIE